MTAVTLAKALRDCTEVPGALHRYEAERRGRVERVVETGKRNGDGKAAAPVAGYCATG